MNSIQKENDKYLVSLITNCGATQDEINDLNFDDETGLFESNRLADWFINQINFGWRVWQEAKAQSEKALLEQFEINNKLVEQIERLKAQAVPEGYHLVKKPKPLIGHNKVDFSQAPKWAKFWLKDGYSKKCWWSSSRPKLDLDIGCFVFPLNNKPIEAPDFEFNGDWTKSITSRKAMIEAQEPTND